MTAEKSEPALKRARPFASLLYAGIRTRLANAVVINTNTTVMIDSTVASEASRAGAGAFSLCRYEIRSHAPQGTDLAAPNLVTSTANQLTRECVCADAQRVIER